MNDPRPQIHVDTGSEWAKQGHKQEGKMEMTREEAKDIMTGLADIGVMSDKERKAMRLAIKALETMPKKVSREELNEWAWNWMVMNGNEGMSKFDYNMICDFVKSRGLLDEKKKVVRYKWTDGEVTLNNPMTEKERNTWLEKKFIRDDWNKRGRDDWHKVEGSEIEVEE